MSHKHNTSKRARCGFARQRAVGNCGLSARLVSLLMAVVLLAGPLAMQGFSVTEGQAKEPAATRAGASAGMESLNDQFGDWTHYSSIIFDTVSVMSADTEGPMAVGKRLHTNSTWAGYDIGTAYRENTAEKIGYYNPEGYPSLLFGGDGQAHAKNTTYGPENSLYYSSNPATNPDAGINGQGNVYGGPIVMTAEMLERNTWLARNSGWMNAMYNASTGSRYVTGDAGEMAEWFDYWYRYISSAEQQFVDAGNQNSVSITLAEFTRSNWWETYPLVNFENKLLRDETGQTADKTLVINIDCSGYTSWNFTSSSSTNNNGAMRIPASLLTQLENGYTATNDYTIDREHFKYDLIIYNFVGLENVTFSGTPQTMNGTVLTSSNGASNGINTPWVSLKYNHKMERIAVCNNSIFNFPDAVSITSTACFVSGSILATDASFYANGGSLNGQLVAQNYIQTTANSHEIHALTINRRIKNVVEDPDAEGKIILFKYLKYHGNTSITRLGGAEFIVWKLDEENKKWYFDGNGYSEDRALAKVYIPSVDSRVEIDGLDYEVHYLEEVTPPVGYQLNTTNPEDTDTYYIHRVEITEQEKEVITRRYNEPLGIELQFIKYYLVNEDDPETAQPLEGVEFHLFRLADEYFNEDGEMSRYTYKELITDADGLLDIEQLPVGRYILREVQPKPGYTYVLPNGELEFTVRNVDPGDGGGRRMIAHLDHTETNIQDKTTWLYDGGIVNPIDIDPYGISNKFVGTKTMVTLYKHDAEDKNHPLSGAVFTLWFDYGSGWEQVESNGTIEYPSGSGLWWGVADTDPRFKDLQPIKIESSLGYYTIENLAPGTYRLVEETAPEGYILDNGEYDGGFGYNGGYYSVEFDIEYEDEETQDYWAGQTARAAAVQQEENKQQAAGRQYDIPAGAEPLPEETETEIDDASSETDDGIALDGIDEDEEPGEQQEEQAPEEPEEPEGQPEEMPAQETAEAQSIPGKTGMLEGNEAGEEALPEDAQAGPEDEADRAEATDFATGEGEADGSADASSHADPSPAEDTAPQQAAASGSDTTQAQRATAGGSLRDDMSGEWGPPVVLYDANGYMTIDIPNQAEKVPTLDLTIEKWGELPERNGVEIGLIDTNTAQFRVDKMDSSGKYTIEITTMENGTMRNGKIELKDLEPGEYRMIERTAPAGYEGLEGNYLTPEENDVVYFTLEKVGDELQITKMRLEYWRAEKANIEGIGESPATRAPDGDSPVVWGNYTDNSFFVRVYNKAHTTSLSLRKVDGDMSYTGNELEGNLQYIMDPVEGATFRLQRMEKGNTGDWVDYTTATMTTGLLKDAGGNLILDEHLNPQAVAVFPEPLLYGNYRLVEVAVPEGYTVSPKNEEENMLVELDDGTEGYVLNYFYISANQTEEYVEEITALDYKIAARGDITVNKVSIDENGNKVPLDEGVPFRLWEIKGEDTEEWDHTVTLEDAVAVWDDLEFRKVLSMEDDFKTDTNGQVSITNLPPGLYALAEVWHDFYIDGAEDGGMLASEFLFFLSHQIQLLEDSEVSRDYYYHLTVFKVIPIDENDHSKGIRIHWVHQQKIWNDEADFNNEKSTDDGWKLEEAEGDEHLTFTIINRRLTTLPTDVVLYKQDEAGQALPGATFELRRRVNFTAGTAPNLDADYEPVATATSGADGVVRFENVTAEWRWNANTTDDDGVSHSKGEVAKYRSHEDILMWSEYVVVETSAPTNYVLDPKPYYFMLWANPLSKVLDLVKLDYSEGAYKFPDLYPVLLQNSALQAKIGQMQMLFGTTPLSINANALMAGTWWVQGYAEPDKDEEGYPFIPGHFAEYLALGTAVNAQQTKNIYLHKRDSADYIDTGNTPADQEALYSHQNKLVGAQFALYRCTHAEPGHTHSDTVSEEGSCWEYWQTSTPSDASRGRFTFANIIPGEEYRMVETVAPEGYERALGSWRLVARYSTGTSDNARVDELEYIPLRGEADPGTYNETTDSTHTMVGNRQRYVLPHLGGVGLGWFFAGGGGLMLLAGTLLGIELKRRRAARRRARREYAKYVYRRGSLNSS